MTISPAAAAPDGDTAAAPRPFSRVFWAALGLEFLERLAFYGVYVNLAVYLTGTVGLGDVENGSLLGVFALVRSWVPVVTGTLADRIGFRRSLVIAFALREPTGGFMSVGNDSPAARVRALVISPHAVGALVGLALVACGASHPLPPPGRDDPNDPLVRANATDEAARPVRPATHRAPGCDGEPYAIVGIRTSNMHWVDCATGDRVELADDAFVAWRARRDHAAGASPASPAPASAA
ncbi:MAG TPA: hypothetical protein VGM56_24305, partial [Byssovorax sp.]